MATAVGVQWVEEENPVFKVQQPLDLACNDSSRFEVGLKHTSVGRDI